MNDCLITGCICSAWAIKQQKLAKIWRAIARRHMCAPLRRIVINYHHADDANGGK